jgi:RecA/RadA recombinase
MKYQSLRDRLIKNTTIKETAVLSESKVYGKKDIIQTPVPIINIALSGRVDGGLVPGLTIIAGNSKHFKSNFMLLLASSFLKKYDDGVILFYDSEFGTSESYIKSFGIDPDRVVHTPITDIEKLKHDLAQQLDLISKGDKVIIIVDSLGNLASKKEAEDAIEGKSAQDMSRPKQIKSLFRIATPHLAMKDIPMVVINHIYMTQEMYSKPVVSGGTGPYLSADNIWIIGRQQEKDKTGDIGGYNFVINIEKSRYVQEKSKFPVTVSFDKGIDRWSGLFDLALEAGYIVAPKQGWYTTKDKEGNLIEPNKRKDDFNTDEFWNDMLTNTDFPRWIEKEFVLSSAPMLNIKD